MADTWIDRYIKPYLHPRLTASEYTYRDFKAAMLGIAAGLIGMLMLLFDFLKMNVSSGALYTAIPLASSFVLTVVIIVTGRIKWPIFLGVLFTCSIVGMYMVKYGGLFVKSIYWMILPLSLLVLVRSVRLALLYLALILAFLFFLYFGDYSDWELATGRSKEHDPLDPLITSIAYTLAFFGVIYMFHLNSNLSLRLYQNELEEKNAQNEELSRILAELKRTQTQLVASEKMASLGQLTAGIAHEINNPINYISGSAEALELDFADLQKVLRQLAEIEPDPNDREAIQALLQTAKESDLPFLLNEMQGLISDLNLGTQRVADIVNELKIFTHPSIGDARPENVNVLLDSALTILNNKLKQREVQLNKKQGDLPEVMCQAGKMSQVFINIIDNAIEAVKEGGTITIETTRVDEQVVVSITDDGYGMNDAVLKQIFEPFFTTKEVGQGTGLGMAVSYGIIKEMGGTIEVKSEPGAGTKVRVLVPIGQPL